MYKLKPLDWTKPWEENEKVMHDNLAVMETADKEAKERGSLLGRYIRHPMGDGYAFYAIVKVNKTTVRVEVITGIGDDWVLPVWGEVASIPKRWAIDYLSREDAWRSKFS